MVGWPCDSASSPEPVILLAQAGAADMAGLDTSRLSHVGYLSVHHDTARLYGKPPAIPNASSHGYDPRGPGADRRYGNVPDTATRDAVADALEAARKAWSDWQDAWAGVQRAMRSAGISTTRIEAYRVGTGYDEGGGQSLEGWLDEIEDSLRRDRSPAPGTW